MRRDVKHASSALHLAQCCLSALYSRQVLLQLVQLRLGAGFSRLAGHQLLLCALSHAAVRSASSVRCVQPLLCGKQPCKGKCSEEKSSEPAALYSDAKLQGVRCCDLWVLFKDAALSCARRLGTSTHYAHSGRTAVESGKIMHTRSHLLAGPLSRLRAWPPRQQCAARPARPSVARSLQRRCSNM